MGALAATTPSRAGTTSTGAAVSASDTVDLTILGSRGAILEILNGNAGADSMTISDSSVTETGAAAAALAPSVPAGGSKVFLLQPKQADPSNSYKVTITHSVTATVTYKLYPLG